ncbi:hypothetical protein TrRE_jg9552 [Triparma retinervis]|uniref:Uncharacterized protein n=1 Tax=Triparma retinervis TaxID=2557542 RepID=A0A9W7AE82_9STRA|nr:hypothetical protein TrRE_jg9552 [Triparma retinervis]
MKLREEAEAMSAALPQSETLLRRAGAEPSSFTHRLFLNFGREENTWMDPSWGRSGRRLECTLDVEFLSDGGLRTSPSIRLRGGFDSLPIGGASYEIESKKNNILFRIETKGSENYTNLGDVSIPEGCFIACQGWIGGDPRKNPDNSSVREGIITVRQRGWHTGFFRMENRIAGVCKLRVINEKLSQ